MGVLPYAGMGVDRARVRGGDKWTTVRGAAPLTPCQTTASSFAAGDLDAFQHLARIRIAHAVRPRGWPLAQAGCRSAFGACREGDGRAAARGQSPRPPGVGHGRAEPRLE